MRGFCIYFILIVSLSSCQRDYSEKQDINREAEEMLTKEYQTNFRFMFQDKLKDEPLKIYEKVEYYFLLTGILESKSKTDYIKFYKNYIWTDSTVDLSCLYQYVPEADFLYLPSNIEANLFSYRKVVESYGDRLAKESSILKAYTALDSLCEGINIKYTDEVLMDNYFNSIDQKNFQNNIVYRAPLISIANANLVDKQPDKE